MLNSAAWYEEDQKSFVEPGRVSDRSQIDQGDSIPAWWAGALQRISYLLRLSRNWDTYGASEVKSQNAYYAVQILQQISRPGIPAPSIVPTVRGNLQFEWHIHGIDLEFEVVSPTHISAAFEDHITGQEWEKDLDYNLMPLADVVKQLVARQANKAVA